MIEMVQKTMQTAWLVLLIATGLSVLVLQYAYINSVRFPSSISNFSYKNYVEINNIAHLCGTNDETACVNSDQQCIKHISSKYMVQGVNCSRLFTGEKNYSQEVIKIIPMFNDSVSDESYINLTRDCKEFRQTRGYIMSSLTDEENSFPIAFAIVAYKNAEMVERLLRTIFRPQNFYCIHIDSKSSPTFFLAISSIAECFSNVFLSIKRSNVQWGQFSVLEAQLICMEELWRYKPWKYFINLTGQEFPLKTNFELVKILKAYNGANNIEGMIRRANKIRWKNNPPPLGLRPVKGALFITASREFVDFILHNDTALAVLNWTKTIQVPDEAFFSTLNFNPQLGVRGTYKGDPDNMNDYVSRYTVWYGSKDVCAGRWVRAVCIQSTGDLYRLGQAKHLFANKFYLEEDRVAIGCLEEKLFNDTRDEYLGTKFFNVSYYANLDFVKNQIL